MADETTDSSKREQLSICVRYVFARPGSNDLEVFED